MSRTYDIQVDNLGPLTTTFTGPSTCLQTTTVVNSNAYYVAAFWDDVPACYPPGTATGTYSQFNFHTLPQFYSPGLCPKGWAPVTSAGADFPTTASDYNQWYLPKETQAWLCCPSGYTYWGFDSTAWYMTADCQSLLQRGQHMTNLRSSGSDVMEALVTISTTVRVDAKGILVLWESTDKEVVAWAKTATLQAMTTSDSTTSTSTEQIRTIFPSGFTSKSSSDSSSESSTESSSTLQTGSLVTATGTRTRSLASEISSTADADALRNSTSHTQKPLTSPSITSPASPNDGEFSTGAKAGVGVGVALGVVLLLLLGFWVGKRRKEAERMSSFVVHSQPATTTTYKYPEMATTANTHELYTHSAVHELPAHRGAAQLA